MSEKETKEVFVPYVEIDGNLPKYGDKIVFREEQGEAIDRAFKHLSKPGQKRKFLWNAKMRFGKTICAMELVRRLDVKTTLIVTHRPVVDDGWHKDFEKIFKPARLASLNASDKTYKYGSRSLEKEEGLGFSELTAFAKKKDCYGVYFVSMQYLALAEIAGGKNTEKQKRDILEFPWNMVIVDEAHEGTQTDRGQNVLSILAEPKSETHKTKILYLSGTPFNLYDDFGDDELYTWDYVMEQTAKESWDSAKGPNPYLTLPRMNIFTYDLGQLVVGKDDSFTLAEFFRTKSGVNLPASEQGKFVHEEWVKKFLDKLCEDSVTSNYPFSTDEYRLAFNHTLWVVPGVKEAKALETLLKRHEIFKHFTIVNVAGDKDDDEASENALDELRRKITRHGRETNTITLSCGRLTTGVTVPEWSAVFYLKGSENTSASTYMQTIFRAQTPYVFEEEEGIKKYKANCYVFDFAPDRSLRMLAETAKFSTLTQKQKLNAKNVGSHDEDIQKMKDFLKFCPVISLDGTMKEFDAERLFTQLNQVYIDRVVRNGFNDNSLYDVQALLDLDVDNLNALGDTIAKSSNLDKPPKAKSLPKDIQMAKGGLTGKDETATGDDDTKTGEDDEEKKRKKERRDERDRRIKIIRGLALRVPLMMFGAEVTSDSEEITRENFTKKIDDKSWEEFMPRGVTKADFNSIKTAFNQTIFTGAGKKIRQLARQADDMTVTERIRRITEIFGYFHNPDKETVLTPWRVVNMHMSETIGGYCFFNESFTGPNQVPRYMTGDKLVEYVDTNEPRFVNHEGVTDKVFFDREKGSFDLKSRILEINSKTGLYPLYVAYTLFRARKADFENLGLIEDTSKYSVEEEHAIWDDILLDNIYVVCNTPMAARITKRTLVGFRDVSDDSVNIKSIKLIEEATTNREALVKKLNSEKFWFGKGTGEMKFNAVVGNPPYQVMTAKDVSKKNGQPTRTNIFHMFQILADALNPDCVSMIYPAGRWIHRSGKGKGFEDFGLAQINDKKLAKVIYYPNAKAIFQSVDLPDGISVVFKVADKETAQFEYVYKGEGKIQDVVIQSPGERLIALDPTNDLIDRKVEKFVSKNELDFLSGRILARSLFGIESEFVELNPKKVKPFKDDYVLKDSEIKLLANDKAGSAGRACWFVTERKLIKQNTNLIEQWQVVVSSAHAGGQENRDQQLEIIDNHSAFGRSRVALGSFKTKTEAENFYKFCRTALVRFMFLMTDEALTSLGKKVPDLMDYTAKNKLVDFSKDLDVQLKKLVGLTDEEFNYINGAVRPLAD